MVYNKLAYVLGLSTKPSICQLPRSIDVARGGQQVTISRIRVSPVACDVAKQVSLVPYYDATIARPVSKYVQFYLAERTADFPGVLTAENYVTHYPDGDLAAQVLGTVGPINSTEVGNKAYRGILSSSIIGQSGLEAQYDSFLRGTDGAECVRDLP